MNTKFVTAAEVNISDNFSNRIQFGIDALDALFGEGIMMGSVITLSAKHGTGKTQFCLQLLQLLSNIYAVGYVSNEESTEQLAYTCKRIGAFNVPIATVSTVADVAEVIPSLDVLVVDSFSKLKSPNIASARKLEQHALDTIIGLAKRHNCVVILITHNTKGGQSRGTSLVQHDVDATLYIEKQEDAPALRRVFFDKNRFGSSAEIYIEMTPCGYSFEAKTPPVATPQAPVQSKAQERYDVIMNHLQQGSSSAGEIAQALGVDYLKATMLLRELRYLGKITKTGRGDQAAYAAATFSE